MMAAAVHPIPLRGLAASSQDLDQDLRSLLLFAVRYAKGEYLEDLESGLQEAWRLTGEDRRLATEKALHAAGMLALLDAPDVATEEVWPIMERIDPYPEPEFTELSERGMALVDRVDADIAAGRIIYIDPAGNLVP